MTGALILVGAWVAAAGLIVGLVAVLRWRDRRSQSRKGT
jgi:hypothetical protein